MRLGGEYMEGFNCFLKPGGECLGVCVSFFILLVFIV